MKSTIQYWSYRQKLDMYLSQMLPFRTILQYTIIVHNIIHFCAVYLKAFCVEPCTRMKCSPFIPTSKRFEKIHADVRTSVPHV